MFGTYVGLQFAFFHMRHTESLLVNTFNSIFKVCLNLYDEDLSHEDSLPQAALSRQIISYSSQLY